MIQRSGETAFDDFCQALEASGQERIVKDYLKTGVKVETEQQHCKCQDIRLHMSAFSFSP